MQKYWSNFSKLYNQDMKGISGYSCCDTEHCFHTCILVFLISYKVVLIYFCTIMVCFSVILFHLHNKDCVIVYRLIEDDQLYAPLTLHKERDATQSSLTPTMTGSGQETEMSVDDLLDSLVLEDIKSFHHYPGPADDLRVKTTETKLDTHDVERETLPRQRTQPQKTRYVHTRGRTNARLKQVMTSLSEKRRSEMELLKKQAAVGENVVTAVSTTEKKTGEVEQMIHTLQLNLAMNGANNTEINSKDLPCEPVLLTKTCCTSKRTQNYYEYARKNKMLSNISQSPVSAEEPVAKTIKTLELNGDLVVEQKVVAKIEEPPLQQKLQQHSPRLKHCMRTNVSKSYKPV